MGVNFPDLQVLLPRTEEIARTPTGAQQQAAQQQSLAMAADARAERRRRQVTRGEKGAKSSASRREAEQGTGESRAPASLPPGGLGRRVDVRA